MPTSSQTDLRDLETAPMYVDPSIDTTSAILIGPT